MKTIEYRESLLIKLNFILYKITLANDQLTVTAVIIGSNLAQYRVQIIAPAKDRTV